MTNDPKSAELSAAVKRLRRVKAGEDMVNVYTGVPRGVGQSILSRYESDCMLLADAYLATVAADEGEVITPEWLASIGFKKVPNGAHRIRDICGSLTIDATYGRACIGDEQIRHVRTRGDVRLVCRALNIALQPSAQEQASDGEAT